MIRPFTIRIAINTIIIVGLPVLIFAGWGKLLYAQAGLGTRAGPGASVRQQGEVEIIQPITGTLISPAGTSELLTFPGVYTGDLRESPAAQDPAVILPAPLRLAPGEQRKEYAPQLAEWLDPLVQEFTPEALMPQPTRLFAGMSLSSGGNGWPPDPNGDVGPDHYMQAVNTSLAIYDKDTGAELWRRTYNQFFQLSGDPAIQATPCYNQNYGDPIVLYDPYVGRWLVSDFAFSSLNTPPFYECLAVSRSSDPLTGGWYFYALRADTGSFFGYLNDYPKLGVWWDGWYMSANMFQEVNPGTGFGVRLWALDRQAMIQGLPLKEIHFDLCWGGTCETLLPANLRGDLPPVGAPEYFLGMGNQALQLWKMDIDWNIPANSTLTGPFSIPVESFAVSSSVPQPSSTYALDSLGPRLMHPLQYQNLNGQESLWTNHTVSNAGVAGIRWYEIGNISGNPSLVQQGTYQPDNLSRWMGSLAVDYEGNMALGYSVSSASMFPGIRYTGRMNGELTGTLTQGENILVQGQGSQTNTYRWGDYSSMAIDPQDGCTFWYTTEYYLTSGSSWQTLIGTFQFPTCGKPKGTLKGVVYNGVTQQAVGGIRVSAQSPTMTVTTETDALGTYTITLSAGEYLVSAGPSLPGYPTSQTFSAIRVYAENLTQQDFYLDPVVAFAGSLTQIHGGAGWIDGYALPGDENLQLLRSVQNTGAVTATQVTAQLSSLTPGVQIISGQASYPDIPASSIVKSVTPYIFSLDKTIACGSDLRFEQVLLSGAVSYTDIFTVTTGIPISRQAALWMDVEGSTAGWNGDTPWGFTTLLSHSPSYSWTDSPGGNYINNQNTALRTPILDLSAVKETRLSGWIFYDLESGWDYLYIEYSLNGGLTWVQKPIVSFTGKNVAWQRFVLNTPYLDQQSAAQIRFRLLTDGSVTNDGVYLDDLTLDYEPRACYRYVFPQMYH